MTRQCRTCAGIIYNRKAKNLFKMENADVLVNIELLSGTTLLNEPDLPTSICACCILDLNQAIVFRERCVKTQERFLERRIWQDSEDVMFVKDDIDMDANDELGMPDNVMDNIDEEVEDLLGFPDGDVDNNSITAGRPEGADGDDALTEDAEILITTMQKEILSFCEDSNEHPDAKPGDIDEVVSFSASPTAKIIKMKSPGRLRISNVNKIKIKNCKDSNKPRVDSVTRQSTRKPYKTWKNLTEEEATERKREQRRRDCVCEQCGRHFTDQSNFKLHMLRHTGVKKFACSECGKRFYTEHLMTLHERVVHKGEKPYACKYCGKAFHNSTTRLIHERIHTNARPYNCEYCNKSFSSASGRKRHELIHTGARPFYCSTCDQPFQRSTHLNAHLKSKLHITRAASESHLPQFAEI